MLLVGEVFQSMTGARQTIAMTITLESLIDTDYNFVAVLNGQVGKNTTVPRLGMSGAVPTSHVFTFTAVFCAAFTVICIKNVEHSCQKWERIVPDRWEKNMCGIL
jgi:hypothetical protein